MSSEPISDVKEDIFGFPFLDWDREDRKSFERETDSQRVEWKAFLTSRKNKFDERWLWQYWDDESRPTSQINKKLFSMFSSRLTAQKKMKLLIRGGVPNELRRQVWWACSGAQQLMESVTDSCDLYEELVNRQGQLNRTTTIHQIEKDIHRTFPKSVKFKEPGVYVYILN